MEIAQIYLGNLANDSHLVAEVNLARQQEACFDVTLSQSDRNKGRIQTRSTSGEAIGIIKSRDWSIGSGDVFRTQSDRFLVIRLQEQQLLVLSFEKPVTAPATALVQLGHILGNHHYPITVTPEKIYLQPGADLALVEHSIKQLQIPGLMINHEWQSLDSLNFTSQSHHH